MKTLTIFDVLNTSTELITANGSTTTLDVKIALRNKGFYATQTMVSQFMTELLAIDDELLSHTQNNHRVFYLLDSKNDSTDDDDDDNNTITITAPVGPIAMTPTVVTPVVTVTTGQYTRKNGKIISTTQVPVKNDFKVSSKSSNDVMYFPAMYTKDEVRFAYSKIAKVDFHSTRAKIVKA